MDNVLLSASDAEKYGGQYIAIASMVNREVISSGKDPGEVLDEASRRGIPNPILVFVPEKDAVLLFHLCAD